jgi:hypothetical protein
MKQVQIVEQQLGVATVTFDRNVLVGSMITHERLPDQHVYSHNSSKTTTTTMTRRQLNGETRI